VKNYKIFLKKSAQKELDTIPKKDLIRIVDKIQALSTNPMPFGVEKLSGHSEKYRIRQGYYRIVYSIHKKELQIWVVKVAHRKKVYQDL
jgi:mRNA interferase RelE/StbE